MESNNEWTTIIKPRTKWVEFDFKELYKYRQLIGMFVRRHFASMYKQTVLGPLWIIINPLLTTMFFTIIFGNIAKLSTDGLPTLLFYLAGTTIWTLFSASLNYASTTFASNNTIFSKIYFPRITVPIASTLCAGVNFIVQFVVFLLFYIYYLFTVPALQPNNTLFALPLLILLAGLLGMGVGIIVTALTTKYKDLSIFVSFAVQLWMYATPVVYPISSVGGYAKTILMLNPMTPIVEAFRYAFTGAGDFNWPFIGIAACTTLLLLFFGIILFNRVEKTFVDTI